MNEPDSSTTPAAAMPREKRKIPLSKSRGKSGKERATKEALRAKENRKRERQRQDKAWRLGLVQCASVVSRTTP